MEIKLKDNWIITADSMDYKLSQYEYKKDKDGNDKLHLRGTTYHGSLENTLIAYKEKSIKTSICKSIDEVIKLNRELDEYIRSITKRD